VLSTEMNFLLLMANRDL